MVMQPTTDFLVGNSNPGGAKMVAPPPTTVNQPGYERRPKSQQLVVLPFDPGLI